MFILLGLLVFCASFAIDYCAINYMKSAHDERVPSWVAANWGALQWCAASVGFIVAVKCSLWYLPMEMGGLWAGTFIALETKKKKDRIALALLTDRQ